MAEAAHFPFVGASYLYLYIYELLSCIGVTGPADALDKLQALYPHYREAVPALAQYLTVWVRDFHVYYDIPGVGEAAAEDTPQNEEAAKWLGFSGYNIAKSKFHTDERVPMIHDCIASVFTALRGWCTTHDTTPEALFLHDDRPKVEYWKPFSQALFHPWMAQRDRVKTMPGGESFVCHNNRWTVERTKPFKGTRELVGFILRKTEARLRELNKFKGKFTADAATLKHAAPKLAAAGLTVAQLENEITLAVDAFHRELHRVHVNVDTTRLTQIRAEANDTQEKLTVEETFTTAAKETTQIKQTLLTPPTPPMPLQPLPTLQTLPISPIADISVDPTAPPSSGWEGFVSALTPAELEALKCLYKNNECAILIKVATAFNLMPEVLAEGINEKALDYIGDNLLDDTGVIYDDYLTMLTVLPGFSA